MKKTRLLSTLLLAAALSASAQAPHKATATASSALDSDFVGASAADGNMKSRWCSSQPHGKPEWLMFDLGTTQAIGRVEIHWEKAFGKAYQLSASDNTRDWKVLFKSPRADGGRDVLNNLNATNRYLRLDCIERGTEHGYSIFELQVFADATTDATDVLAHDPSYVIPIEKDQTVELPITQRYLNIPLMLDRQVAKKAMTITIDGKLLGVFQTPLAYGQPDYYGFFDLSAYQGKTAKIEVKRHDGSLANLTFDAAIKGSEDLYREKFRPQFHFSAKRGWLNDPNGMIYYKGEYHFYSQYNPMATYWGNMSWIHAVSKDMVHWEERPAVLFPDPKTGDCFSGASFIDWKNQLGKKTGKDDVIVAAYLRTKIGLALACSNDRGNTFTDFEGNPVLNHEGARIDTPRPFWFEPTKRWVAPTYDFFTNEQGKKLRCVGFYSSSNLVNWEYESRVEQDKWGDELCGCVDFFQLPIDGKSKNKKWVMIFIDGSYIIGEFDGKVFRTLEGKPAITKDRIDSLVMDVHYYATMTFENDPKGRRVQITWMKGPEHPKMPFNQQMTVPSELTLHSTPEGPRLRMNPIKELEKLRVKTHKFKNVTLKAGANPLAEVRAELIDFEAEFAPTPDSVTEFNLRGIKFAYDAKTQVLSCAGMRSGSSKLAPIDGKIRVRALLDRSSLEVYGNDGRVYFPMNVFPKDENRTVSATCSAGEVKASYLRVHELRSIWK